MSLRQYRSKRHFDATPEPAGEAAAEASDATRFVIQKHDARRLHFDFRLEMEGVLKSWAVPRGPSLHPTRRRLAVMTEDHPLEYAAFEGMIPAGQYGGGPVIIWDQGTWDCKGSASVALAAGKLKFQLHGERLRGGWTLVRTSKGKTSTGEPGTEWLLIKERDSEAVGPSDPDPAQTQQTSVVSGRTLEQIRIASKLKPRSSSDRSKRLADPQRSSGNQSSTATLGALPNPIAPKLPRLVDHPPRGEQWVHELKLDGYRMQARVAGGQVQLLTRNHQDWTQRLPALSDALAGVPVSQAVFDGELVALDADGATDFAALQSAFRDDRTDKLVLFLFDLLYIDGESLIDDSLLDRKARLEPLIRDAAIPRIQYLDHLAGDGRKLLEQCRARGLEGIVSKRRDRGYRSGRADDWLKCKCRYRERFVVGGFTRSGNAEGSLGALLLGYHDTHGRLIYAGRVGTGWNGPNADSIAQQLGARQRDASPFDPPPAGKERAEALWVAPEMVVEASFSGWTRENRLRHATFDRVAESVPPRSVVRDALTVDHPPGDPHLSVGTDSALPDQPPQEQAPLLISDDSLRDALGGARLTNADRVLYPAAGYTKMDLVSYLAQVSAWLLPHIEDRPLSIIRCPHGIEGKCFFQKHVKVGTPSGLKRVYVKPDGAEYLMIDDSAGLFAAAQMNGLELHPWGCRRDRLDRPDRLIFDLDPDVTVPWGEVITAGWQIRERLEDLGLSSFVKTTGGKGLHVTVPLARRHSWDRVFEFASEIAKRISAEFPQRFTANMTKRARVNRIFIDFHRNRRGATAIAPYSPRAREGATVATPLQWSELTPEVTPDMWTIRTVPQRLMTLEEDPWANIGDLRQSIKKSP